MGHIVDTAVATHGNYTVTSLVNSLAGDIGAVVDVFGIAHGVIEKILIEILPEKGLYLFLLANA